MLTIASVIRIRVFGTVALFMSFKSKWTWFHPLYRHQRQFIYWKYTQNEEDEERCFCVIYGPNLMEDILTIVYFMLSSCQRCYYCVCILNRHKPSPEYSEYNVSFPILGCPRKTDSGCTTIHTDSMPTLNIPISHTHIS